MKNIVNMVLTFIISPQIYANCVNLSGQYQVACPPIHIETGNASGTILRDYSPGDLITIQQHDCNNLQFNGSSLFNYLPVMNKKEKQHFQQDYFVVNNGFTQINRHGAYADLQWDIGNPYDVTRLSYLLDLLNPRNWAPQKIKIKSSVEFKTLIRRAVIYYFLSTE